MQREKDLKCLDELIADLGGAGDAGKQSRGRCDLLLEHLQAARRNLLGSMPGEYRLSLQQGKESAACISDKSARAEIKRRLQSLIDSETPKQRSSPPASTELVLSIAAPLAPAL